MNRIAWGVAIVASLSLWGIAVAADDFSLDYTVERTPATRLSLENCAAAIKRGAEASNYTTRPQQERPTLAVYVAGPPEDGGAVVAYCIQAGDKTVYVVQTLDYSGPTSAVSASVKDRIVAELQKTAAPGR